MATKIILMRKYLIWWRNLPKEEKQSIMTKRNIKAITFGQIKEIYEIYEGSRK